MLVKRKNQALLLSTLFAAVQFLTPLNAVAQPKGAPPAPTADPAAAPGSGPIDIQAHEQEFTGDHVVAKGNVKVLYKDTLVFSPLATLYRDLASGQPQKAIFNGHPHLIQGDNKIDSDQLIFEMTTSKIFADGHAHSEVVNNDPVAEPPPTANKKATGSAGPSSASKGGKVANGKGGFEWPTQESDRKKALAQKHETNQEPTDKLASAAIKGSKDGAGSAEGAEDSSPESKPASEGAAASTAPSTAAGAAGGAPSDEAPTKLITDSVRQEYDRDSGRFEAFGNVKVIAGDIHVTADHLKLAYGIDHRPEAAIFDGHVNAIQEKNDTTSDFMTYFLITKRLQASGHVRSKVIQEKNEPKPVPKQQEEGVIKPISNDTSSKTKAAPAALTGFSGGDSHAPIIIVADSQDYNKETGRLDAVGNARVFFEDTIGIGPKVILMRNADGRAEKILFIGRSQVTQKGKRWIGDRVTIMVNNRRIIAEGNTKAIFMQKKPAVAPAAPPLEDNTRLAGKTPQIMSALPAKPQNGTQPQVDDTSSNQKLSATRVDRPE